MALRVAHFALPVAERQGYLGLRPCPKFDDGNGDLANFAVVQETKRMTSPDFDLAAAHRHFSAACFNGVWELIDKPDRSPDDDRKMVSMAHASLYHWQQRPDCTSRSLSIGYWQLSRVHALLGQADNARQYGRLCLTHSQNEEPFYLGYAYEALTRAAFLSGNRKEGEHGLMLARQQLAQITDAGERELLENDLKTVAKVTEVQVPSLTSYELDVLRQSVLAEIHEAFQDVSREGGVSWSESEVIDDYGDDAERDEARSRDLDTHWTQLVDDPNWHCEPGVGGFTFLDPIGFRYYLAPGLVRIVRDINATDGIDLEFRLGIGTDEPSEYLKSQHSLLDTRQRKCIARCLLFFEREAATTSCDNGVQVLEFLDAGWSQYLEG